MIIIPANTLSTGAYEVANSCRFSIADSTTLTKAVSSSATTKYTLSLWVKRGLVSSSAGQRFFTSTGGSGLGDTYFRFNSDNTLEFSGHGSSATTGGYVITNRLFRDSTAWMHIVIRYDSTQGTANDRFRLYINGVDERNVGGYSTSVMPNQNVTDNVTANGNTIRIGDTASTQYFDGYMAEIHFSEGQSYAPTEFGEYNEDSPRIWQPKEADISYGTSGFHLDFEDSSNMGNDKNGGTDFGETNIDATNQATDTCTNNFATLNPLWRSSFDNDGVFSQGNCKVTFTSNNSDKGYGFSTMGVTAGRWYWEIKIPTVARASIGVGDANAIAGFTQVYYDESTSKGMQVGNSGSINENNTSTSYANSLSDNDIVMFALDMDNHRCWYGINGTWQDSGDPTSGSTGTGDMTTQISDQSHINTGEFIFPFCFDASTTGQASFEWNFGGCPAFSISSGNSDGNYGNFEYAPPSGFLALCTKNLGSNGG